MKKKNTLFRNVLLLFLIVANLHGFSQSQKVAAAKTVIVDRTDSCLSFSKHSYQIFVPSVEPSFKQLPLIVVIDPHGDGKLAVGGFKDAAQKYKAVVVGSNLIKNNDPNYIKELEVLIADVKSRYPIGNILFVGGFSGGARMALGYAAGHPVNGVLACGALAQDQEIRSLKCKIMCLIGMEDFNFTEAAPFVLDPMGIPSNLAIEITKDSHNWPEKELLRQAFGYLVLSVMPPGTPTEKRNYVRDFTAGQKQRIDLLQRTGKNLQAALAARNMMVCPAFEREITFMGVADNLMQEINYQQQVNELNKNIQFETKVREAYYNSLVQKDSLWWSNEIEVLNSKIKSEKNEFALQTFKRIKGFLGIVCYSFCQRFESEKDAQKLGQVLLVYRMVEPDNTAIPQFSKTLAQLKKTGKK